MRYLTQFSLLLFVLLLSLPATAQVPVLQCEHPDYNGLRATYESTNGESWTRADGWMTTCDPCRWYGIRCDANDRVSAIALPNNGLTGELPEAIGELEFLKTISAPNNAISGTLPAALFSIDIWDVFLSDNFLTGSIPEAIAALKNLRFLRLQNNDMSGPLPQGLTNLRNLRRLHLENNQFQASLPVGLAELPDLEIIDVRDNQLSGCLPEEFRSRCGDTGIYLTGNLGLPWSGDFDSFCNDALAPLQVGAPCNDGDPTTLSDVINEDCGCGSADATNGLRQDFDLDFGAQENSVMEAPGRNYGDVPANDQTVLIGYRPGDTTTEGAATDIARQVSVYPNPFTGTQLTISLPENTERAGLRLYSMTGNTITTQVASGETANLAVPQLTAGFYFVEVVIDGQRSVKKLLVE